MHLRVRSLLRVGKSWQTGTLTLEQIEDILHQAKEAGVTSIYFEGGEPFLYYAILNKAVHIAADMGFSVGIVSNAYWANSVADAEDGCVRLWDVSRISR